MEVLVPGGLARLAAIRFAGRELPVFFRAAFLTAGFLIAVPTPLIVVPVRDNVGFPEKRDSHN